MQILSNRIFLVLAVACALAASALLLARPAEAKSIFDIEFPVAELGGCADRAACKAYCNQPENEDACTAFAKSYGIATPEKSARPEALRKIEQVKRDGGPGNCAEGAENPAAACKAYCDSSEHMETCVAYAKEHDLMGPRELEEADKVIAALKGGAKLPAGCKDAGSCKATCEDPPDLATARECFAFGKAAGLLPEGVSVDQVEKVLNVLQKGTGPFKTFAETRKCERPDSEELFEKCLQFGIETGFIPPEQAEVIKKTKGAGPGGCRGRAECDAYCNSHQDECMAFGEQNGLVRPEDTARMREGIDRLQQGLMQAPEEVRDCVQAAVPNLDDIYAGKARLGRDIHQKMQSCFEALRERQGPPPGMQGPEGFQDSRGFRGQPNMPFGPPPGEGGEGDDRPSPEGPGVPGRYPMPPSGAMQRPPTPEEMQKYREWQSQNPDSPMPTPYPGAYPNSPSAEYPRPSPEEMQKYQEQYPNQPHPSPMYPGQPLPTGVNPPPPPPEGNTYPAGMYPTTMPSGSYPGQYPPPPDAQSTAYPPPPAGSETSYPPPPPSEPISFFERVGEGARAATAGVLNALLGR